MAATRIYLIKNLSPWMMDELLAFAAETSFTLILLRTPETRYNAQLSELTAMGVKVVNNPYTRSFSVRKMLFIAGFILRHLFAFANGYSAVIGWKSALWFLKLDLRLVPPGSVIHAQFATQPALMALMIKKYTGGNTRYYFTFHAYDIYFSNRWFALLVNESEKAFSISQFNIGYVAEKFSRVNRAKLELARLGAFPPGEVPPKPAGQFTIGFLGRFVEKKGVMYLLEAMKVLQQQDSPILLVLAGDGPLMPSYRAFIAEAGLKNVSLPGSVQGDSKHNFFGSLHAFVMPSVKLKNDMDGIPVVLMETVSYNTPMIATDVSGMKEICINNRNGLLIPERDVTALVNAISSLASDPAMYQSFSEGAKAIYKEYDIRTNSHAKLMAMRWLMK